VGKKVVGVTCKDITGINGYLSKIYKYSVELATAGDGGRTQGDSQHLQTANISVILKMFSYQTTEKSAKMFGENVFDESKTSEWIKKMTTVHTRECNFYSTFGKLNIIPLAECYYMQELDVVTRKSGILILEDLTERAYMDRIEDGMSRQKVENIVKHLAAFHKFILCSEEKEEMLKPFKEFPFESDNPAEGMEWVDKMIQRAVDIIPEVESYLRRLKKAFSSFDFMRLAVSEMAKQHGVTTTLVHGDLWTNNMLWLKSSDGKESDEPAAFIDWQMTFVGNPMADIGRVLMCCDTNVRREMDTYILQLYHDEVSRLLREDGKGRKLEFTVSDLRPAFEISIVHQAMIFSIMVPLFATTWSQAADLTEEDKAKNESKLDRLKKRLFDALDDAVKILERLAPEWIDE